MTAYPIPATLPTTPPAPEPWPGWTGLRYGPNHERPDRPQDAGHEREAETDE